MSSSSRRRHKFNSKDASQETKSFTLKVISVWSWVILFTGDEDVQQLREMYGPQC